MLRECLHRIGKCFIEVGVRGLEGRVGIGHVQSNAFMLQNIDT